MDVLPIDDAMLFTSLPTYFGYYSPLPDFQECHEQNSVFISNTAQRCALDRTN